MRPCDHTKMIAQYSFRAKVLPFNGAILPNTPNKTQSSFLTKCFSSRSLHSSLKAVHDKSNPVQIPRTYSQQWNITIPHQIIGFLTVLYPDLPWTETLLSTVTSLASQVILPALIHKYVPPELRGPTQSTLKILFDLSYSSSTFTLIIDEYNGQCRNEIFDASLIHLRNKINPSAKRLRVCKSKEEDNIELSMERYNEILEVFEDVQLKWKPNFSQPLSTSDSEIQIEPETSNHRSFELSFNKKHKDKVIRHYLPHILNKCLNVTRENSNVTKKIYTLGNNGEGWKSTKLDHTATFTTIAMDPELQKDLMEDLDRFIKMKELYRKVGKARRRGYLLYGPPGTGKSTLISAIANHLKFDIYKMNLVGLQSNSELRKYLLATKNKSILAFEDIDCSAELHYHNQVTLSGLLNLIDGLWPNYGDERIIIFTANQKDQIEPALLRPGCMDMLIHMNYCTPTGFKLLASNYHQVQHHPLFREIERLVEKVTVTPAEVCEQLMKSEDTEIALQALIGFLCVRETETKKIDTRN